MTAAADDEADQYRRFGEATGGWLAAPPIIHCAGTNPYPPADGAAWS